LEILPGNILLPKITNIEPAQRESLLYRMDTIVRHDIDIVYKQLLVDTLGIKPGGVKDPP
jgi:hypothetical protein